MNLHLGKLLFYQHPKIGEMTALMVEYSPNALSLIKLFPGTARANVCVKAMYSETPSVNTWRFQYPPLTHSESESHNKKPEKTGKP